MQRNDKSLQIYQQWYHVLSWKYMLKRKIVKYGFQIYESGAAQTFIS